MIEKTPYQNSSPKEILEALRGDVYPIQEWGCAIDQTPLFSVQVGGGQKPAILITAGAHAHESAGIFAALRLIHQLKTDFETHIFPIRDPFGFSGVNNCLSFASNLHVDLSNHLEVKTFLTRHGDLLLCEDGLELFYLGDIGFIWTQIQPRLKGFEYVNRKMKAFLQEYPEVLAPLCGKSVLLVNPAPDFAGSELMQRCWHGFVDENGRWLNLNRSFDVANNPPEVGTLVKMIVSLKPGLIIDMQEDDVPGFWIAAPKQKDNAAVLDIGKAILEAVSAEGFSVCSYEQMAAQKHRDLGISGFLIPEREQNGYFWLNQELMNEGSNLISYAAAGSLSIGIESPLDFELDKRVNALVTGVLEAIDLWTKKYQPIKGRLR